MAAILAGQASGQPAWGPVYQWGEDAALNDKAEIGHGYFKQVSTGYDYTIGLRPNGTVVAWGTPLQNAVLSNLPAAGTWVKIEAGWVDAVALHSNGSIYVWGHHFEPEGCEETILEDCEGCVFSDVAAGENIMVGIVAGSISGPHYGDLFVWGQIECFDPLTLTDGGYIDSGASPFVKVSCAGHHILAQKANGTLVAIGNPLGDPDHDDCEFCCESSEMFNPGEYPPPSEQFDWWGTPPTSAIVRFSAGHGHSLVWSASGGLYGWGHNKFGQTGTITTEQEVNAVPDCDPLDEDQYNATDWPYVLEFESLDLPVGIPLKIEGSKRFSTAHYADGTLWGWGENSAGLGYASMPPLGTFLAFSAKQHHGAAISTCYVDANGDGVVDGADVTYFGLLMAAQDPSCDCDGDGPPYGDQGDEDCFDALWELGCEP